MCNPIAPPGGMPPQGTTPVPGLLQPTGANGGVSGGGPTADLQAALEQLWSAIGALRGALEGAQSITGGGGGAGAGSGCGSGNCCGGHAGAGALGAPIPMGASGAPRTSGGDDDDRAGRAEGASEFRAAPAGTRLVHPLKGAKLTSHYGEVSSIRNHRPHSGTDFALPSGAPIAAAAPGRVSKVGFESGGLGHFVELDHGNGWTTRYGHMLEKPPVAQGAVVGAGDAIGKVGSTGNSTGPHLHFMVLRNGKHENPMPFLEGARTF
jgi:murein DD-endopeptidase MepM/ murein hydrolase activator NlpD